MSGGIDEIQLEGLAIALVFDGDRGGLDGDSAFAFEIHRVEHLVSRFTIGDGLGGLQQTIGKRALAVVDVRDDGEVAYGHGWISRPLAPN